MAVTLNPADKTKKLTPDSPLVRLSGDDPYPFIGGENDLVGASHFKLAHPDYPQASCSEEMKADGSYQTMEVDKSNNAIRNQLDSGHLRHYVNAGSSKNTGGNDAGYTQSNKQNIVARDHGKEVGNNVHDGAGGGRYFGQKGDSFYHNTGGKTYVATSSGSSGGGSADHISHFECDTHSYSNGDHIHAVVGNKHVMISNGEYGIHVQKGNMDTQVDNGKIRISSGSDMLFVSSSKITLQVGDCSIVMDGKTITLSVGQNSGIKIDSSTVSVTQTAYIGDSKPGAKDASESSPPTHFP